MFIALLRTKMSTFVEVRSLFPKNLLPLTSYLLPLPNHQGSFVYKIIMRSNGERGPNPIRATVTIDTNCPSIDFGSSELIDFAIFPQYEKPRRSQGMYMHRCNNAVY